MKRIIRRLNALPESWISVDTVTRERRDVRITFTVRRGRRGRSLESFTIVCRNVREMRFSDFDGGGLRLYSKSHPAAKQYCDPRAALCISDIDDEARVLGFLLQAHTARKARNRLIASGKHYALVVQDVH